MEVFRPVGTTRGLSRPTHRDLGLAGGVRVAIVAPQQPEGGDMAKKSKKGKGGKKGKKK